MLKELIVVALPIGNAEDMSFRVKKALQVVDGVLAEDTRKFRDFCRWAGLDLSCEIQSFDSNKERDADYQKLFEKLNGRWALVTDAGTPAVNDPGSWIVKSARHHKIKVTALPGASALTLALQMTGGFGNPTSFLGFTPKKVKKDFFEEHCASKTLIFFESKHNVLSTLEALSESHLKDAKIICLREMTKEHEEYIQGNVAELKAFFEEKLKSEQVGELTFVVEGLGKASTSSQVEASDLVEFRKASPSQAAKLLAKLSGLSRDEAYELLSSGKSD
ncbi:MAG: SAM-dependent methyltransferase [Bdellovibrionota bacterium]